EVLGEREVAAVDFHIRMALYGQGCAGQQALGADRVRDLDHRPQDLRGAGEGVAKCLQGIGVTGGKLASEGLRLRPAVTSSLLSPCSLLAIVSVCSLSRPGRGIGARLCPESASFFIEVVQDFRAKLFKLMVLVTKTHNQFLLRGTG